MTDQMDDLIEQMAEGMHAAVARALGESVPDSMLLHYQLLARDALDALKAGGWEVVRLPEPLDREEDDEFTDFPGVGLYVPVVFDRHPGEVQIRAGAWCDEPLSAYDARELAASILAAARAAGEQP